MGRRLMTCSGTRRLMTMTLSRTRRRATCNSTLAVSMRIAATVKVATTVIVAAVQDHVRPRHHPTAAVTAPAVTSAAHGHDASRGDHQCRDSQPKREPVSQSVFLVHTDLPFAEDIKQSAGSRNTTNRVWIINRTILAPWVAPQVWRADKIKSPNVESSFGFILIRRRLTVRALRCHGVFSPSAAAMQRGHYRRLHRWPLPCRGHRAVR
jgi:hypothetical protein